MTLAAAVRRGPLTPGRAAAGLLAISFVGLLGYLAWDDARFRQETTRQTQRASDLSQQLLAARAQASRLGGQVTSLQTDNSRLQDEARSPTLPMWNSCGGPCSISPNAVRVGSVPDTFQLQINFTSDVPIHTYVFTFHQWTEFDSCGFSTRCVSGAYTTFNAATSVNRTFDDAEGCSGYVWVLQAEHSGTIKPDVQVHYLPADHPTGVCASSP